VPDNFCLTLIVCSVNHSYFKIQPYKVENIGNLIIRRILSNLRQLRAKKWTDTGPDSTDARKG